MTNIPVIHQIPLSARDGEELNTLGEQPKEYAEVAASEEKAILKKIHERDLVEQNRGPVGEALNRGLDELGLFNISATSLREVADEDGRVEFDYILRREVHGQQAPGGVVMSARVSLFPQENIGESAIEYSITDFSLSPRKNEAAEYFQGSTQMTLTELERGDKFLHIRRLVGGGGNVFEAYVNSEGNVHTLTAKNNKGGYDVLSLNSKGLTEDDRVYARVVWATLLSELNQTQTDPFKCKVDVRETFQQSCLNSGIKAGSVKIVFSEV